MTRNLKALGVAVVAVLALSAMVASAAQAAEFKSEEANPSIRATQTEAAEFTAAGATISCTEGVFQGMAVGASNPELLVDKISYNKCKFLFFNTTVETHKCGYNFHAGAGGVGTVDIVANGNKECTEKGITFSAAGCTVSVFPQNGLGEIKYANNGKAGNAREVIVTPNVKNIVYDAAGLCPENGKGQKNGVYKKGAASATGAKSTTFGATEMVGVFYE
jgi:hypothetical protein